MKEDREINAMCIPGFCLAYMTLALPRLICNYATGSKNNESKVVKYATSMWLFGFLPTLMVVFFIAYCAKDPGVLDSRMPEERQNQPVSSRDSCFWPKL